MKRPPKTFRTRLVHGGRSIAPEGGQPVNPPVVRASTAVFDSIAAQQDMRARRDSERLFTYGARGTPTGFALESMIAELEAGYRTRLFPTGLAAIAMTFTSYLAPGDHVLIVDSVYDPVRRFAANHLARLGIRFTYFRADEADVERHIGRDTRMIYVETPGSAVFEMSDLPALAHLARRRRLLLVADNTWGSGLQYRPLALGADVSIMAATKYLSGHSDVVMGAVTTTAEAWPALTGSSLRISCSYSSINAVRLASGDCASVSEHDSNRARPLRTDAGRDMKPMRPSP